MARDPLVRPPRGAVLSVAIGATILLYTMVYTINDDANLNRPALPWQWSGLNFLRWVLGLVGISVRV